MWTVEIIVITAMTFMNAIFAGYEIALAGVSIARLRILEQENHSGARAAVFMKKNMEASLIVIQMAITLCGAVAAATGGAGAKESIAPFFHNTLGISSGISDMLAITIIVLPLTVLSIVFGELVPKVFALKNQEWICLTFSPAMKFIASMVKPVVKLFEGFVKSIMKLGDRLYKPKIKGQSQAEPPELMELKAIAWLACASNLIGDKEKSIILNAARLSRRYVHEIMLPAENIKALNANDTLSSSLIAAHLYLHTRFPVAEIKGDAQSIIGYVNFKDIVALMRLSPGNPSIRAILRPVPAIQSGKTLANSLELMMRERTHIALIRDSSQKVVGMITMEDILEELVGDIQDEYDRLPVHIVQSGIGWVVGGGASCGTLKEKTGIDLTGSSNENQIISSWILNHIKRQANGGEIITHNNLRIIIRKIRRDKICEIQIAADEK